MSNPKVTAGMAALWEGSGQRTPKKHRPFQWNLRYPNAKTGHYLHFDSWRLNMVAGLWLPGLFTAKNPTTVVARSARRFISKRRLAFGVTRCPARLATRRLRKSWWTRRNRFVTRPDTAQDASPVQSERMWEREAEDNILERLQKTGVMAPEGEVDRVMQTVVNNLIFTNNLDIQPEVRTRVLLTTPLESFTIGHTIVLSRGLLLMCCRTKASLAVVLAHELAQIRAGSPPRHQVCFQ